MLLGDKIDLLYDLKLRQDEMKAKISELGKEIDSMEYSVLCDLEEMGLDQIKATKGTATKKVEMYPQIKDKQAFVNWIVDNGKVEMIQSRISSGVFKEYFEQTGAYPDGVDTFQKSTLTFRKSK